MLQHGRTLHKPTAKRQTLKEKTRHTLRGHLHEVPRVVEHRETELELPGLGRGSEHLAFHRQFLFSTMRKF